MAVALLRRRWDRRGTGETGDKEGINNGDGDGDRDPTRVGVEARETSRECKVLNDEEAGMGERGGSLIMSRGLFMF